MQYPNWPTYSRRIYMAMSHGCGEMDEGYCFSTPPVGIVGQPAWRRKTGELTNRRVDHDATDKNCDDVGSQG